MSQSIAGRCVICGNKSSYDEETIKGCTHEINGTEVIICTNCEEEMQQKFQKRKKGHAPSTEDQYLSVAVPGTNMFAQAKLTDEGIVLDLFEQKGEDVEVVKSTYKFFDEMGVEVEFVEE